MTVRTLAAAAGLFYDPKANKGQWFARAYEPDDDEKRKDGRTWVVASTPTPDRADDVVAPDWQLEEFEANPVVMWAHQYDIPPVGKVDASTISLDDGGVLRMAIDWDTSEHNELGRLMHHQYANGYMSAVSVGFRSLDIYPRVTLDENHRWYGKRGNVYEKNVLLELSAAPIPMNSEALKERVLRHLAGQSTAAPDVRAEVLRLFAEDSELRALVETIAWGGQSRGPEIRSLESLGFGRETPLSSLFPVDGE